MLASLVEAVKRNHGLEHATVSVMLGKMGGPKRMFGHAMPDGFYLYADVPDELVHESAHEALQRMKTGEGNLAVSPLCGTNIVIAGVATALISLFTVNQPTRFSRFPSIVNAATLGIIAGRPLGAWFQKHLTTSPRVEDMEIVEIKRGMGPGKPFLVRTRVNGTAAEAAYAELT
ncbi:MAG: DUF6391 domain-containing protein [Dehalococcoidia bacterium]